MVFGQQGQVLRAAVLGSPIAHSLSPVLHTAAYAARGLSEWRYDRREVAAAELAEVVGSLDDSWRGLSLTMPLKEAAFEVATTVSETATSAGAINTLVRRADDGWDATNTDVHGIVEALRPVLTAEHLAGAFHVIGAGATARSAILAARELGFRAVGIRARRREAADGLWEWAREQGFRTASAGPITTFGRDERVVVSTVPPAAAGTVADAIPAIRGAGPTPILLDVVYANWPTPPAVEASRLGWTVISGLDMLVHQAAAQFELFTGVEAPVEAMFAAGRAALDGD